MSRALPALRLTLILALLITSGFAALYLVEVIRLEQLKRYIVYSLGLMALLGVLSMTITVLTRPAPPEV
jgi:hypothetical protein